MTIANLSHSSDELPDGNEAHGEAIASAHHQAADQVLKTEKHQPDHVDTDITESDQPTEAAELLPAVDPGVSVKSTEAAAPAESEPPTETAPAAESAPAETVLPTEAAATDEPALPIESGPLAETAPAEGPALPTETPALAGPAPPAEPEPPTEDAPAAESAPPTDTVHPIEAAAADRPTPPAESAPLAETAPAEGPPLPTETALPTEIPATAEPAPQAESEPPTETASAEEPALPTESAHPAEANAPPTPTPHAESAPLTESAPPSEAAQLAEPASWAEAPPPAEPAQPTEPKPPAEPARLAESAPPTEPPTPTEPATPAKPASPQASGLLLFVAAFVVFAVLIAVGAVLTLNRTNSATGTEPAAQPQTNSVTDTRALGTVDSSATGVKGHLTTKWDGMVGYNFIIEPDDPARQAAFALMVSNPPRPASVRIQIKSSDGVVLCFQDVLLKFDPRKAAAISNPSVQTPGGKPLSAKAIEEMKSKQEAEFAQEEATEAQREHDKSIFQLNTRSNGTIESISSQGEMPCPQTAYEGMGYWSFLPDFPSVEEQTAWLNQKTGGGHADSTVAPAVEAGGHNRAPDNDAPQPGKFLLAGDDSIVAYDAAAGNIHTRTGKVFSIDKAGPAARAIARLGLPARIRYSCNQNNACTLTQGDAMVVRARLIR